jgi:hypothetical protein
MLETVATPRLRFMFGIAKISEKCNVLLLLSHRRRPPPAKVASSNLLDSASHSSCRLLSRRSAQVATVAGPHLARHDTHRGPQTNRGWRIDRGSPPPPSTRLLLLAVSLCTCSSSAARHPRDARTFLRERDC